MRMVLAILALVACASTAMAEDLTACRLSTIPLKYRPPTPDLAGPLPIPDYLDTIIACTTSGSLGMGLPAPPRPASAWLDAERKLYSDALARSKADVLVVPFQIQGRGLDRVERALMAADLAYAIGDAGSVVVADPFITSLALGEGMRRIDMQAAERLAQSVGAKRIVAGYVGHDGKHHFTLTLQVIDANRGVPGTRAMQRWQHDWRAVEFSNERTPSLVFHDLLPEVIRTLPLGLEAKQRPKAENARLPAIVATSPIDTVKAAAGQSTPAATLLLLGSLASPVEERVRERLLERALISSLRSGSTSPSSTFVEAYALMGLERRPAALARIARESQSDTDRALAFQQLRAFLNGELKGSASRVQMIKDPFQRFLLELELRDLAVMYEQENVPQITTAAKLFGPALRSWQPLIDLRADDIDPWKVGSPIAIKDSLDNAFPSQGLDARSIVRGRSVAFGSSADSVDLDIAVGRHVRAVASRLSVPECCRSGSLRAGEWDLLWLLQADGERRIDKDLYRTTNYQGQPQSAIQDLNRYEPFFSGHPILAVASAEASNSIARKSPDDERDAWEERARRDARAASWWVQNQSWLGERSTLQLGIPSPDADFWVDGYGHDFPLRPTWPRWFMGLEPDSPESVAFAIEALAFSRTETNPIDSLRGAGQAPTREEIGTRFAGNPRWDDRRSAGPLSTRPPVEQRIAELKKRAATDADDWGTHYELGVLLLQSGAPFEEAQKAFLRYSRFHDLNTRKKVELSNEAYTAGSLLYLQGQTELAKPLYQVAADLDTGSDASLAGALRLELMQGHYRAAAEGSLERGQRYSSANAYRDYLSLLHALGEHKEAWEGFSQLKEQFDLPQTWVAALAGQRMEGLDEGRVRAWMKSDEIRKARFKSQLFASWYAVLWNSTDRLPPADLGALVEELEGPPAAFVDEDGYATMRPHPVDAKSFEIVMPQQRLGAERHTFEPRTKLKSERAYFADGYSAVARGDYAAAIQRFDAMMDHYPLTGPALSYLAYAASKAGKDVAQVLQVKSLDALPEDDFDARLARAFSAAPKNVPEARRWLGLALRVRPNTDYRPVFTEFQYAQACEWLLRDTHDDGFRTMLLDWVKGYQKIQPAQGWAYAMQYTYEKDPAERVPALAMARYLDPTSPRLKGASAADVAKAKAWWKAHNPFAEKQAEGAPAI